MKKTEIAENIKKQAQELIERYLLKDDERLIIGFDEEFEVDFTVTEQPLDGWISWASFEDHGTDIVDVLSESVYNI